MRKVIGIVVIVMIVAIIGMLIWYNVSISAVGDENDTVMITIPLGSTSGSIIDILSKERLIRNGIAFKIYIKLNSISNFQAGTYYLNKGMNIKEITQVLQTGIMYDENQLRLTYIEGKTMEWLANKIEEITNNTKEDVYALLEDKEYINALMEKYWFITDEVTDEGLYYPLEGYLFPETYFISNADVTVEEIFEKMLDKMDKVLQNYKDDIDKSGYTVHQLLTLASIIEKESIGDEGRKDVSSVIYNRLKNNMAIQSDVTTYYAFRIDMGERDLYQSEINTYNKYNTRGPNMEGKLPIGPISSVSKTSIEAAIFPNNTNYLFFVADKNGKLYFSTNNSEHNQIIKSLKDGDLWLEYEGKE